MVTSRVRRNTRPSRLTATPAVIVAAGLPPGAMLPAKRTSSPSPTPSPIARPMRASASRRAACSRLMSLPVSSRPLKKLTVRMPPSRRGSSRRGKMVAMATSSALSLRMTVGHAYPAIAPIGHQHLGSALEAFNCGLVLDPAPPPGPNGERPAQAADEIASPDAGPVGRWHEDRETRLLGYDRVDLHIRKNLEVAVDDLRLEPERGRIAPRGSLG